MENFVQRKTIFNAGLVIVTMFFIYSGLDRILNNSDHAMSLDRKLYNVESYCLQNYPSLPCEFRSYLPFQGSPDDNSSLLSKIIVFLYGAAILVFGSASFFFFDDKDQRAYFLQLLIITQFIDAFLLHFPFVEEKTLDTYSRDMKYFMLTLGVTSGILMLLGYRNN